MRTLLLAVLLLTTTTALAQRVKADEVPTAVKAAFAREHADHTASWWSKTEEGYEATVLRPKGQTLRAAYGADGANRFTATHYPGELVPTQIKSKLGAQYPTYRVSHANEIFSRRGRYLFVWLIAPGAQLGVYVTPEGDELPKDKREPAAKSAEMNSN